MKKMALFLSLMVFLLARNSSAYEFTIAGKVAVEDKVTAIAESPEIGLLAAVSKTGKSLFLIDVDARQIIKKIALDTEPAVVVFDTKRNRMIVLSKDFLSFIDIKDNNAIKSMPLSNSGSALAVSDDWDMALIATDGGITKLDLTTDNVISTLSLPVRTTGIKVFGDAAIVSGVGEKEGSLIFRVNIHDGTIEKQLKMDFATVGIDANKTKGLVFACGSNGDISLYDSDLTFLNKLSSCDPSAQCSMAAFSFHLLMNSVISVDAIKNKIIVTDLESKTVNAATLEYKGLGQIVTDSSRNTAMIINENGVLTAKLENPVPRIDSLIPQTANSGSSGFTISIEGDRFVRESQALFNGKNVATYFKSIAELQADISTEDLLYPGDVPVTVKNPPPGGGLSNTLLFKIYDLVPVIEAVSPEFVAVNSSLTLRTSGKNFFNGSIITFNGINVKTRFISSILLEAEVNQNLIAKTGIYSVVVVNPQPDGLTSNPGYLTIVDADDPRLQDKKTAQSNASQGTGSLKGKIVNTELKPLQGVTIKIKNLRAVTDAQGNFLMANIPTGKNVLLMDGSTAQEPDGHYPTIPITVNIKAGIVNDMPFQPYLHRQKSRNFKQINLAEDTVLTDPEVPGFELRIPKGVKIIGWDGKANLKISVRTVPTDRLPVKPLPQNSFVRTVHMFYFDKIGGGTPDRPIPIKAVNDLGLLPGEKAVLWYYDESPIEGEAPNDWAIAGTGTVTSDGRYIVSDPGVGIPKFCCGATAWGGSSAGDSPSGSGDGSGGPGGPDGPNNNDGEPVNLATGYFIHDKVDYSVPGSIPFEIKRFYRSSDTGAGAFGKGTYFGYDWWLGVYSDMLLLLKPGNYQYRFYKQPDGTYVNTTDPGFRGAVFYNNGNNTYTLREKNGWSYKFGTSRLLDEIKDNNGNTITFLKQIDGNISTIILPDGQTINISYVILGRDNITSITGPFGTVTYSYYSNGANGQLKSVKYPDGSSINYEYDTSGRMSKVTKNGNLVVSNEYDADNRVTRQTLADGGVYTFTYTVAGGYVTQTNMTEPNGAIKTWRFNNYKYITDMTTPNGATSYARDPANNQILSVTDPLQRSKTYAYDTKGRVIAATDNGGNVTAYEYEDVYNKVTKITGANGNVTMKAYDTNGNLTSVTDPLGKITNISYNSMGKPISVTDALGNVTSLEYDSSGNLTKITDPLGNAAQRVYDPLGRLTQTIDAKGVGTTYQIDTGNRITDVIDGLGKKTHYGYDVGGNLLTVTDAKNHNISYDYDARNRRFKMTDQLGSSETYSYDTSNNVVLVTDRKGQTTIYSYDQMRRIVRADYADSSYTTFGYDAAGRITAISDSISGMISYTYTDAGCSGTCSGVAANKVASETTALGTINYTYDAIGRRTSMTAAGQPVVNYTYDADNRLTTINTLISGATATFNIGHDDLGRRMSLALPNGVTTSYTFDNANRLLNLQHVDSLNAVLESLSYTYDANSNRISMSRPTVNQPFPNIASNTSYNDANQILTFNDKNIIYDNNGNMSSFANSCGTTNYTWDARNRLAGISGFAPDCTPLSASFKYDALGRRIEKTINGQTIQYLYDGCDLIQEFESGTLSASYIRTLSIDQPVARIKSDGTVRYYQKDALGSIIALTDETSVIKTQYIYDPFGNMTVNGEASDNPFQYTGRENDGTGLYYYRARYYSPELQRFISEDPIRLLGGVNFHVYVGNNPVTRKDPSGLITAGVGVTVTVTGWGWSVTFSTGIVVDGSGNLGTYSTVGTGPGYGTTAFGGVTVSGSDAPNISDLGGPFVYGSGGGGTGLNVSGDGFFGDSPDGPVAGGGLTFGVGAGAGGSAGVTGTIVTPLWPGDGGSSGGSNSGGSTSCP